MDSWIAMTSILWDAIAEGRNLLSVQIALLAEDSKPKLSWPIWGYGRTVDELKHRTVARAELARFYEAQGNPVLG